MEQIVGIVILVVIALAALVILKQSTYRVKYPDGAIVTLFGEVWRVDVKPGLKFRIPSWIRLNGKSVMEVIHEPGGRLPYEIPDETVLTADSVNAKLGIFLDVRIIRDEPTKDDKKRNRVFGLMNPEALQRFYAVTNAQNIPFMIRGYVRGAATQEAKKHDSRRLVAATEHVRNAIDSALDAICKEWGLTYNVQVTELNAPSTVAAQEKLAQTEVEKAAAMVRAMGQVEALSAATKYLIENIPPGYSPEDWDKVIQTFLRNESLRILPRGTSLSVFSGLNGLFNTLMGGAGDVVKARLDERLGSPDNPGLRPPRPKPARRSRRGGP